MASVQVWFYQGAVAGVPVLKEPHIGYATVSDGGFAEIPPMAELAAIETDGGTYYNITADSGKDITTDEYPVIGITANKRFVIDVSKGGFIVFADV